MNEIIIFNLNLAIYFKSSEILRLVSNLFLTSYFRWIRKVTVGLIDWVLNMSGWWGTIGYISLFRHFKNADAKFWRRILDSLLSKRKFIGVSFDIEGSSPLYDLQHNHFDHNERSSASRRIRQSGFNHSLASIHPLLPGFQYLKAIIHNLWKVHFSRSKMTVLNSFYSEFDKVEIYDLQNTVYSYK